MDKAAPPQVKRVLGEIIKTIVSLLIIAGAIGFAAVLYLSRKPPANKVSDVLIPTVEIVEAKSYSGNLDLVVSGTVVPYREIKVAAEVGGRISVKHAECDAGTFVKKGTPLLEIDPESFELEVKTLEAEVAQSRNVIIETEKELEGIALRIALAKEESKLLENEYERNLRLKDVVSTTELDQAKRALLTAQSQLTNWENNQLTALARLDRVKSALDLSSRKLERAHLNLEKTKILAPDDGVVVKESVEQGDFVSVGSPLLTFEVTQRSEVICNLTTTDLNWIKQNVAQAAGATTEDLLRGAYELPKTQVAIYDSREPTVQWVGTLQRFDGIGLDKMTKTIPVRVIVEQPVIQTPTGPRSLVRGMFVKCRVEIPADNREGAARHLIFPAKAVRSGSFIWTVENNKLKQHRVKVVDNDLALAQEGGGDSMVIVKVEDGGLQAGAQVVISPMGQPADGSAVKILGGATEATAEAQAAPTAEPAPPAAGTAEAPAKSS